MRSHSQKNKNGREWLSSVLANVDPEPQELKTCLNMITRTKYRNKVSKNIKSNIVNTLMKADSLW